jgi:hypothetical protein
MSKTYSTVAQQQRDTEAADGQGVRKHNHPRIAEALVKRGRKLCGHVTEPTVNTTEQAGNTAEVKTVLAKQKKQEQGFDQLAVAFAGLEVSNA